MKTYSFENGVLSPGLRMQADEKLGNILFLGEVGRGRRYEKVGLFRQAPAVVTEGRVCQAHPVKIVINRDTTNEKSFVVLAAPKDAGDQRILVRVNTCTGYVRGGAGSWSVIAGKPEAVVKAYGAYGDAGRIGSWADDLVVVNPGDILDIDGSRSGRWVLDYRDPAKGPVVMTIQDWNATCALEKAQKEGGEWL